MSLIHKALKKAGGNESAPATGEPPIETLVGGGKKSLKEQLTPRTLVLLGLAILALIFMLYKRACQKSTIYKPVPSASVAPAQPAAQALPLPEGQQIPASGQQLAIPSSALTEDEAIKEGQKLYQLGKLDEALAKFLEAQARTPENPVIYNDIGLIYKKKNNFAQAETYYKKALSLKADYAECLNNLGVLKAASGDVLEASIYLKKALASDATYADAYFNLAVLNDEEGNFKDAIINYKSFLQYTETTDESLITKVKERIDQLSE